MAELVKMGVNCRPEWAGVPPASLSLPGYTPPLPLPSLSLLLYPLEFRVVLSLSRQPLALARCLFRNIMGLLYIHDIVVDRQTAIPIYPSPQGILPSRTYFSHAWDTRRQCYPWHKGDRHRLQYKSQSKMLFLSSFRSRCVRDRELRSLPKRTECGRPTWFFHWCPDL